MTVCSGDQRYFSSPTSDSSPSLAVLALFPAWEPDLGLPIAADSSILCRFVVRVGAKNLAHILNLLRVGAKNSRLLAVN